MPKFEKGKTGNPNGRPKKDKALEASIRKAFVELARKKPWLVKEALERGLAGSRPLGYLELAARLLKEIGAVDEVKPQVVIIFDSGLDASKLRPEVKSGN